MPPPEPEGVEIPWRDLSEESLRGLIEAFVGREGTDYGRVERGLEEKVEAVLGQLRRGEARVLFEGPHDVDRWDVRDRHDELVIAYREYVPSDAERPALARSGERFVFLCVRRGVSRRRCARADRWRQIRA